MDLQHNNLLSWVHYLAYLRIYQVKVDTKGFQDYLYGAFPKYTETDVNRLAVNSKIESEGFSEEDNPHSTLTQRRATRELAVGTAQIDGVVGGVAPFPADLDDDNGGKWDQPEIPYAAEYPHNHVYESEGGHLKEFDDTKIMKEYMKDIQVVLVMK